MVVTYKEFPLVFWCIVITITIREQKKQEVLQDMNLKNFYINSEFKRLKT